MKKIVVIVLIVVIVIMVGLLVFKHMADGLKIQSAELEGDIVTIEGEIDELKEDKKEIEDKNSTLLEEKKTLEDKKQELNDVMKGYEEDIKELEDSMPRADLSLDVEDFNLHLAIIALNTKPEDKDKYTQPFTEAPIKSKNDRGDEVLTYYLYGDKDSEKNVSIVYVINRYDQKIMEIVLEYNGKEQKSLYDEYVSLAATSFAMLNERPYFYNEKFVEEGKQLLSDKKYLDGKIIVVEENKDDSATITIKPAES